MSHRYDHIPLLPSDPGGFCRSWSHRTYPATKVQKVILLPNFSSIFILKEVTFLCNTLYISLKKMLQFSIQFIGIST